MVLKVGLTGGIGSGKTIVASFFKVLGIPVFDADAAAKEIMEKDASLMMLVKETFGEQTYHEGKLNRKHLAEIVFKDPFQLEKLNALVHPATIHAAEKWIACQTTPYIIKEAALLFEAGSAGGLDHVIGVTSPRSLRIKRVMERSNMTREEVIDRMNRQVDDQIKMKLCDFVIVNDEQEMIIPQVLKIHEQLLQSTAK